MRQLLPVAADPVDIAAVYADLPAVAGRPAVRLNMIASLDGVLTAVHRGRPPGGADRRHRSRRILAGPPTGMTGFALHTVCEDSGYLFLRLRRAM